MTHEKRRYPAPLWLFAFLLTALVVACGLYLALQREPNAALFLGLFPTVDSGLLLHALPLVYTALEAAGLCLAAGFILGGLLVLAKRRTGLVSIVTPLFILAGGLLLFVRELAAFLPPALGRVLMQMGSAMPPAVFIAIILTPMAIISTGSFALALDTNLYKAAVSLGASPAGTYAVFLFPRLLLRALPCFIAALLCALLLALLRDPLPELAADALLVTCAALLSAALLLLLILFAYTRKPRRISPC